MSALHRVPAHGESFTFLNNSNLVEHTILSKKDAGMHAGFSLPKSTDLCYRNRSLGVKRSKFN